MVESEPHGLKDIIRNIEFNEPMTSEEKGKEIFNELLRAIAIGKKPRIYVPENQKYEHN